MTSSKKIRDLENNVYDESKVDLSTTKLSYECLSEAEQTIADTHILSYDMQIQTPRYKAKNRKSSEK